jgi:predicted dehydrogenase/threonine dehydrogenase-like Zn-dependent dehydrogenase
MKQVVQDIRSGMTSVVEVPVPTPGRGQALIRTGASLVSVGTERMLVEFAGMNLIEKARSRPDLVRQTLDKARREGVLTAWEAVRNRLDQPMALGYSSAGTVVAFGDGLAELRPGDRVACAGGGYAVHAEYALVPRNLLSRLPDEVGFEAGAFATLGAIALHGFRLAEPQVGERVAVIGLGLVGLLAVGVAQAGGCSVLGIDLDPRRVEVAKAMGAHAVGRAGAEAAAAAFSRGQGYDVVLVCADTPSADPLELAAAVARDRARVVAVGAVGMQLSRKAYYDKELSLRVSRSYGPGRYDPTYEQEGVDYPAAYVRWTEGRNLEAVLNLMATGKLDVQPLISHRFPIERAAEAYDLITSGAPSDLLGVILTYPQSVSDDAGNRRVTFGPKTADAGAPLRLGAIGAGNFATAILFPALHGIGGIEKVGVASSGGLKAAQAARRFGFRYAASSASEILEDPSINTVAVLTRHDQHVDQVVAALGAGKHVFCEKPLALDRESLGRVAEAVRRSNCLLTVGFNRRFAPMSRRLQTFVGQADASLLMVYRVNAGPVPLTHWVHDPAQGGGRIVGEVCHFIDLMTFLCGSVPVEVSAYALPDDGRYRQDNVSVSLRFANGSVGTVVFQANGDRSAGKERLEVSGGGRTAMLDDFRRLDEFTDGRRRTMRSMLRQDKGHRAEWETFAQAVAAGGPPPIAYEQLFAVTSASFAAVESLRSGQRVIVEPLGSG